MLDPKPLLSFHLCLCSLSLVWCCWFVGHVWVSEMNWESEWAEDIYPLVVSLGKGLSNSFRKKKIWMSNYPCSAVHGGRDPVGKQFQISEFHILFTNKSHTVNGVNGKDKLCKYVEVFFFWGALSQSLMSLLHQTAPSRMKRVDWIRHRYSCCITETLASYRF